MIQCKDLLSCLDGMIDGEFSGDRLADIEKHLESCETCRREHSELTLLIEKAATLPSSIEPKTDLWPDVEARIRTGAEVVSVDFRRRGRTVLLAAAAVLVGFSIAALVFTLGGRAVSVGTVAQDQFLNPSDEYVGASIGEAYASIQGERERVRAQLLEVLAARGDEIAPTTRQTVVENLKVIDEAFGRIVTALEDDPNSPELNQMLLAAYYSELGMLRQISNLPAAAL
ncbi:MAG: zf-HC2 domain-containing protein [bacterium]|nr:zf-HC2 domain-containing protein [bacterium]